MTNTRKPENPYVAAVIVGAITSYADKLNEAAAEHLTSWLLTRDWVAVVEWCLFHAAALQQL